MIMKNENDIYIYFETISQLEPKKILDVGMVLKRVGSIARKVMDGEVPENVQLDGINIFQEVDFPVWKQVYNNIYRKEEFLTDSKDREYDLIIMLGMEKLLEKISFEELRIIIMNGTRFLLTDTLFDEWKINNKNVKVNDLFVEEDLYYLIEIGV